MAKRIAMRYNVAVLLIAHPRKEDGDKKLTNESISGSGDIANRVDTVLTYERAKGNATLGKIGITKNRLTGYTAENIEVRYGQKSKRIGCNNNEWNKVYGCFKDSEPVEELPPF
jgi:RecA-family ATPase